MTKMIQIGTMALRAPDGSFLPSRPIYRKAKRKTEKHPDVNTIDLDDVAEIFYEKYKAFKKAQKKEAERRKNEDQTDEHLPVLRACDQA